MMKKVAIVTGGSSGIGKATCTELAKRGCSVYEFSRRENNSDDVTHISVDITDETEIKKAIETVIEREGHIDILINNAGFGISGAVEFTDTEDAKRLFDVNFFGMVRMTSAVLPYMRQAGSGKIVNTSSVAAVVPIPFQTYYSATKAAINSYTFATANEVASFGITVCAVMPGDIKTGFTAARDKSVIGNDIYNGRITRSVSRMEHDEQNGMDPDIVGKFIASVALSKRKKPLYAIGFAYKTASVAVKLLPASVMNKIVEIIYAR